MKNSNVVQGEVVPEGEVIQLGFEELLYRKIQSQPKGLSMKQLMDWVMNNYPDITNLRAPLENLRRQRRIIRLSGGIYQAAENRKSNKK